VRRFTAPTDDRVFINRACIQRAQRLKIGVELSRMNDRDLSALAADGCQALIVASDRWRIGDWQAQLPFAVNFHPSLLPNYRGPDPLVNGLLAQVTRWGVTCHEPAHEFDGGNVVAQRAFDVAPSETQESLDWRTQMASRALAGDVAANVQALWRSAKPQHGGSDAPLFGDGDRSLNFELTVAQILRTVRALGHRNVWQPSTACAFA